MKLKAMIEELQDIYDVFGDLEVYTCGKADSRGIYTAEEVKNVLFSEACPVCEDLDCTNAQQHVRVEGE